MSFKVSDQGLDLESTQIYNELTTYDYFYFLSKNNKHMIIFIEFPKNKIEKKI